MARASSLPTIDVTPRKLEEFELWLRENGRGEGTAALYVHNVARCASSPGGISARLVGDLAPKTKHTNLAALQAWATFEESGELVVALKKIRLPPSKRVTPKVELTFEDWKRMVIAVQDDETMDEPVRSCILIMSLRGLRISDALRLKRKDIRDAIRTKTLSYEGKGSKRLEIDATPILDAITALSEEAGSWERVEDLVVKRSTSVGLKRRKMAAKRITRNIARIAHHLSVESMHPHRLRRTYATHYAKMLWGDPQAMIKLQKHMGWSSLATAAQYVDAVDDGELSKKGNELVAGLLSRT